MADQKNPKGDDFGTSGARPAPAPLTPGRERATGSVQAQPRERVTGSVSTARPNPAAPAPAPPAADRERKTASGVAPADRERRTGSVVAPADRERTSGSVSKPIDRERVTSNLRQPVNPRATGTQNVFPGSNKLTAHQREMHGSAFQDSKRMDALKVAVGDMREKPPADDDDDEATALGKMFDGETPAKELTGRDLFKSVQAPVQSRENRRSKQIYLQVINQFAVGNNPRYQPDAPDRGRSHIFIWDVSRAMNTEIPHFFGARELSLGQTVDWIRHECPVRGWHRAGNEDAVEAAAHGLLVIAMPKEIRLKQLAIVRPEPADTDGRPRLAAAAVKIGNSLSLYEALGVYAAEFYYHA